MVDAVKPGSDMIQAFGLDTAFLGEPPDLRAVAAKVIWYGRGNPDRPQRNPVGDGRTSDKREIDDFTDDAVQWIYNFGMSLADRALWSGKPLYSDGVTVRSVADPYHSHPKAIPYRVAPEVLRVLAPDAHVPAGPIKHYPRVCRSLIRQHQLVTPFVDNVFKIWINNQMAQIQKPAA